MSSSSPAFPRRSCRRCCPPTSRSARCCRRSPESSACPATARCCAAATTRCSPRCRAASPSPATSTSSAGRATSPTSAPTVRSHRRPSTCAATSSPGAGSPSSSSTPGARRSTGSAGSPAASSTTTRSTPSTCRGVLDAFFGDPDPDAREAELPDYVPYLGGSRYSLERLKGSFSGLTLETTRDDLLLSIVRGNAAYLGGHLREVAGLVPVGRRVGISGGGATIRGMLEARRRWTGDFEYVVPGPVLAARRGDPRPGQSIGTACPAPWPVCFGSHQGGSLMQWHWHREHDVQRSEEGGRRARRTGEGRPRRARRPSPSSSPPRSTTRRAWWPACPSCWAGSRCGADRRRPASSRTPAGSPATAAPPASC